MTTSDPPGTDEEQPSLIALVRALIEDAQTLVEAETGYWRKAVVFALSRIKSIALLAVLALFFAFFALMALVVGLLLALAPLIGTWGALGLVTGILVLATVVCVRAAIGHSKRMMRLLTLSNPEEAP